jgi:2',3'-cyclic-nucleotide 2'-phosphodiesterase (5'-nucleotidase family)
VTRLFVAIALVTSPFGLGSCVAFNAECSPPIDQPDLVVTWLAGPVPIDRPSSRLRESAFGDAITDAYRASLSSGATPADIAIENGGAIRDAGLCTTRTALAKGPLTRAVLRDTLPFSNSLVTVEVTEAELFDVFEHAVSQLAVPGAVPAGAFLQVSGVSFDVDCTFPPEKITTTSAGAERTEKGRRVQHITLGGRTFTRATASTSATVRVALNDFLAGGGDNFVDFKGRDVVTPSPERYTYSVFEAALQAKQATSGAPLALAVDAENPRIVLHHCE